MTYTHDQDELRKRITTLAIEGERMVLLDNLTGCVGNGVLDAALTADTWKDRVLGSNKGFDGPLNVIWYATGNNVQLGADLSRRICHVRMESSDERPELRGGFKYPDLRTHVRANRGRLLTAALTVLRAYIAAGKPDQKFSQWGSFEGWSNLVRSAVVFAGLPDPADTREALLTAADQEAAAMTTILDGLEQMDPARLGLTAAQIVQRLTANPFEPPAWLAEMRSAAEDICRRLEAKTLGLKFRHFKRRNFGGKMLDAAGEDRMGGNRWAVFAADGGRRQPGATHGHTAGGAGGAGDVPPQPETAPAPTARRYRANPNRGVAGLGQEVGAL